LNNNIYSGYGYACSHCTSSFLTRDLLEKHELMHISNATMVSSLKFFFLLIFQKRKKERNIKSPRKMQI
jgi:hypothetical protein